MKRFLTVLAALALLALAPHAPLQAAPAAAPAAVAPALQDAPTADDLTTATSDEAGESGDAKDGETPEIDTQAAAQKMGEAADSLGKWVVAFLADTLGVPKGAADLIGKAVVFVLILLVFRIVGGIVAAIIGKALSKSKLQPTQLLLNFLTGTTRNVIFVIGIIMALGVVGVNVAPLLAGIGVVGFVVGFALQDTLSNFAAGVMILLYRPFDVGHFVTAGGVTGTVKSMSLVSTTLATPDNQVQVVPNGSIWGNVITNVTANPTRRVDLVAGVSYEDDIEQVEAVLQRIVDEHPLVLKDPAPVVKLHALADSSVNFIVRPWVKTSDYWTVYWDLTRAFKKEFDAAGISIPYPQRDVHLYSVDKSA
ncbi:MAG: mechanosensitive ion channel [Planctomycetota bacterium]